MLYKSLFLPVDKPLEDGCDIINQSGEVFTYNESSDFWHKEAIRRAELFLVSMEFNQLVVIGKPSPAAKWLTNGIDVKAIDCEKWLWDVHHKEWCGEASFTDQTNFHDYWRIKCPSCGQLH